MSRASMAGWGCSCTSSYICWAEQVRRPLAHPRGRYHAVHELDHVLWYARVLPPQDCDALCAYSSACCSYSALFCTTRARKLDYLICAIHFDHIQKRFRCIERARGSYLLTNKRCPSSFPSPIHDLDTNLSLVASPHCVAFLVSIGAARIGTRHKNYHPPPRSRHHAWSILEIARSY